MHINEKILELYAGSPEQFTREESENIKLHLDECAYCRDIYDTYFNLFRGFKEAVKKEPDELDRLLADKLEEGFSGFDRKRLPEKNDSIQIHDAEFEIVERNPRGIIKNVRHWIKRNPIKAVSYSFVFSFILLLLLFKVKPTDYTEYNPVALKLNDFMLEAYNINGDLLWKKNVSGALSGNIDSLMSTNYRGRRLMLEDIDGDNLNEVLLTGGEYDVGNYHPDTLYCFNYDGSLRWKAAPESERFNYAPKWKRTKWVINQFLVAKRGKKNLLFIVAHDYDFGGCVVSTLNPATGNIKSSLYHSGHITAAANIDIDLDGDEEIFFGGVSSYYKPFLMVIDRDTLMGVMPDFYSIGHKVKGNASYYILFPVTVLASALSRTKSIGVSDISKFNDSGIVVKSLEYFDQKIEVALQFVLDKNFNIQYITATPTYLYEYEKIKKIKITSPDIINDYLAAYKDSLQYWDGDKFVNYPAKNKYWNEKFKLPE